ncbi:uncharacterized protein LOC125042542 isoform X4 [Penaeus chinensis]|uniref:uncharacterized protein LOC125042542 isoform X4 n=1 Tax=Penaeus chinensis TaxID=139456 RepID=UPI001FB6D66C|nr:uncharacterized protein LOC125042542 isoform X4 [Penaeus chinensis]
MMAEENKTSKNDTVGLFLRAMVDREPGKRKVKPSKAALIDLAELDLGESSDDSDFNVDEAKLNDDDDISINSDPDAPDIDDDDNEDVEDEEESEEEVEPPPISEKDMTVTQLLEQAKKKQALELEKGIERPKILVCAVCLGDHSDDLNEIVTCDGCSVSVHEGCYGISDSISVSSTVSSSSTEPWFCDACKAGVDNPPCELCPNLGQCSAGYTIFKETEMGRWVHLVCALYIPGVAFSEVDKLSFPTLFEMPYSRWGSKTCTLCEDERFSRTGVCIGCDAGMCRAYFHVTCAQREGLLSEVNHGEADQADPYYAHCKLHTDRELIRRRKRNWLALQLHMKQGEADKLGSAQETQDRIQRKLSRYRDKYLFNKNNRPTPWYPTQKMPRALSTSASLFRSLLHKTELMGLSTESQPAQSANVGDIRKKWHIPPAFNVEFISYYIDRTNRLSEMKERLDQLLTENGQLIQEEMELRVSCSHMERECDRIKSENDTLLNKALEMHDLLKGLAGRPLPLPPVVAALHNPPSPPLPTRPLPKGSLRGPIMTKAAAKMMMTEQPPPRAGECWSPYMQDTLSGGLSLNRCRVCQQTKEQHLLIECDTCGHYYHLSCLDPPLTRMPKKTKQMGWQCSDCCKSSDSDKASEVDTAAPRRLRRNIKEPAKFSPSIASEPKLCLLQSEGEKTASVGLLQTGSQSQPLPDTPPAHLYHPGVGSLPVSVEEPLPKAVGNKRRKSGEGKKTAKKRRKSQGDTEAVLTEVDQGNKSFEASPASKVASSPSTPKGKKAQADSAGKEMQQMTAAEPRTGRGKKTAQEGSPSTVVTPTTEPLSPSKTRRAQNDASSIGHEMPQQTSSPSRHRRQIQEQSTDVSKSPQVSLSQSLKSVGDSSVEVVEVHQPHPCLPPGLECIPVTSSGTVAETSESVMRRRIGSNIHLDTSVESLPSVASLHSPTSESFHSAEDDPMSPRKEKRHRDGSKKKKKDKDKELEGGKKRKKHHHRDKHGLGEMASEMVTPVRIKIKPLRPRPLETSPPATITTLPSTVGTTLAPIPAIPPVTPTSIAPSSVSITPVIPTSYQTTTPPAGYPPLPPGYTLTQPMAPPSKLGTMSSTSSLLSIASQASTSITNTYTTSGTSRVSPGGSGSGNRRRSDPSDPQQFSKCDVCGETGGVTNTVSCDECHKAYHFNCLEPPLKKSPKRRGYSWFCEDCDNAT